MGTVGTDVPALGFRACGSLTVLRTEAEVAVAKQVVAAPEGADRGVALLDAAEARRANPALRGPFLAALWCSRDAAVESRVALPALRAHLAPTGRYRFLAGREARRVDTGPHGVTVLDHSGARHHGDLAVLCPGATLTGLAAELVAERTGAQANEPTGGLPVRRVRLQMMQTAPLGEPLPTAIADGDSLRYYPAFAGPALDALRAAEPQPPATAAHRMQLLCVQRSDGGLTVGDTHDYTEPFPFDLDEAPYHHLTGVLEALLDRALPRVARRWPGVYAECVDPAAVVHRQRLGSALWLVTGPGGRGMTLAPAIAEDTAGEAGL